MSDRFSGSAVYSRRWIGGFDMIPDILAIIGFIVVVAVICKVWNLYARKQLKKEKEELKK